MSTIADTALRSLFGLAVVAAMFVTIWAARDSGARSSIAGAAAVTSEPDMPEVHPARDHRAPVRRISRTGEQLHGQPASPGNQALGSTQPGR